jgi:hypothetical protein
MFPLETNSVGTSVLLEPEHIRRWTVQEYHRMAETNVLDPDEATELIAGQI